MILSIDTSCYTTSIAIYDPTTNEVVLDKRIPLTVAQGSLGLRQSDGVFLHNGNLRQLFAENSIDYSLLTKICVSDKPRNAQDSYMPVFTAGVTAATLLARALSLPLYKTSHQLGHILAGLYSAGKLHLTSDEFLTYHISGGTTELLHYDKGSISLKGKTLDISMGQLIDRVGVRIGLPFPCGAALDSLAKNTTETIKLPIATKDADCNLSGLENKAYQLLESGIDNAVVARSLFECLAQYLVTTTAYVNQSLPLLIVGGVAANSIIREKLTQIYPNTYFASPRLSTDNAVGVAIAANYGDLFSIRAE